MVEAPPATLTPEQRTFWDENGYLILPRFFSDEDIRSVEAVAAEAWRKKPRQIVVDDLNLEQRKYIFEVTPEEQRDHLFKLNDLYLEYPQLRAISLRTNLATILQELLGDAPVQCNSLNFYQGSEQPYHMDSLFMTPRTPNCLAATWIAMEDCHPDAGLLFYYPGSHRIPMHIFSNNSHHFVPEEMGVWNAHIDSYIESMGLQREEFLAKRGDVLIWHANLLHGGTPIRDTSRSRRSLVSHYFTLADCQAMGNDCQPAGTGYWLNRQHHLGPPPPPESLLTRLRKKLHV